MQVEGTKEAFIALISQRGIYKFLDVDRSTVANWKSYIKAGKSISLDKMEEMLIKAGASVVSEKVWEVKQDAPDLKNINMADFLEELKGVKLGDTIELGQNINQNLAFFAICEHADKIKSTVWRERNSSIYHFPPKKP